jgi:hypothetical protein
MEEGKYNKHAGLALKYGQLEAYGGALQSLLSSYTNLAAGVLILWRGVAPGGEVISTRPVYNYLIWRTTTEAHRAVQEWHRRPPAPFPPRYGGLVTIQNDGTLTVGKLITFQLYWSACSNLAGVLLHSASIPRRCLAKPESMRAGT